MEVLGHLPQHGLEIAGRFFPSFIAQSGLPTAKKSIQIFRFDLEPVCIGAFSIAPAHLTDTSLCESLQYF